jgi:signal transduction histidine kinase
MLMEPIILPKNDTQKVAVLVVDDEYGPRESVAFSLSTEFAVETAERASEALAKVKERSYGAVILDIRMPEMDGITALQELRKVDPHVSVIMLTGYGTLQTAQQAMVGGANQYLRKPPDVNDLLLAVRKQTHATQMRRHQAKLSTEVLDLNAALKQELERNEPQMWQARASAELVHDLSNPLTVVMGYATLLVAEAKNMAQQDKALSQRFLEYASMVEKAADYCRHLAENWRRTSKKTNDFTRMDLVRSLNDVRQVIFFGNLAIQIAGLPEAVIMGSNFELMRVFQNLLKNALEAGATEVSATLSRNADRFDLVIADNGEGMDGENLKRALRGGFTSKESGTGLGLNISRHLVAAHGGTFVIDSEPGKGTTVRLTFPVAPGS